MPEALQLDPMLPLWLLAVLAALGLAAIWRTYRTLPLNGLSRKLLLGGLRGAVLMLLFVCLLRPVLRHQTQLHEKSRACVALDASASMALGDMPGGATRWSSALRLLGAHGGELSALEEQADVQRYLFSAGAQEVTRLPGEGGVSAASPGGNGTDLADLFERIADGAAGIPQAGVLLLTDGRHNLPGDVLLAAANLAREGVPLFIVGFGQEATPAAYRDVKIRQLLVPEKTFVGAPMRISVDCGATLPEAQNTKLRVEVDGKRVYEEAVAFAAGTDTGPPVIEISHVPETTGVHRVTATLEPLAREANLVNNSRTAFFRAFRGRIGVWYVEGALRKEYGAIRAALQSAPNLRLNALNASLTPPGESPELLPDSQAQWGQLRLVIIGDLAAERFAPAALRQLAAFAGNGGGLLLLGGLNSFGKGGWRTSPVAPLLPVRLSENDALLEERLPLRVPAEEVGHPVLKLLDDPARNAELWRRLPLLPGVNTFAGVQPLAHVLLRAGPHELLVAQDYGRGRTAVFATDMTWQWGVKAGQGEAQKTFWRNLALWLAQSDYRDNDKSVFADTDRLQYRTGDEAVLGVHVYASEKIAGALKDSRVAVTVARLPETGPVTVLQEDVGRGEGEYTRRFAFDDPGAYRFTASVIAPGGKTLDSDSLDLQVSAPDLENDNPKANLRLLRHLAELTGGAYFTPERAGEAFAKLTERSQGFTKTIAETLQLWSSGWMWLALVALLTLEWSLRKRWGLI